jgi:hypothetical protein
LFIMTAQSPVAIPSRMLQQKTGDWWKDDRRNWCAYCGAAVRWDLKVGKPGKGSRDHVVPKAHSGRHITIPCCIPCNKAKGAKSLPEFMVSAYFSTARERAKGHHWSLRDLWLVTALAAVEQARSIESAGLSLDP